VNEHDMVSGVHGEARRLRVTAALLTTAERSAGGRLAAASPMSSKMKRTIRMVESISWFPSLFHCFTLSGHLIAARMQSSMPVERFAE
jgi:hypothetical protein